MRTADEIAAWATLGEQGQRALWLEIGRRRVQWRRRRAAAAVDPGPAPSASDLSRPN